MFNKKYNYDTTDTDKFVEAANKHIDFTYAKGQKIGDSFFLALSSFMSSSNIEQKNGGPFGAVIVEFDGGLDAHGKGIGKPHVIGIGANHVVPNNDPSAHAEMEAYRDAAKRKGFSDLNGAVLYTSCECCPMCLTSANGSGIKKITYLNTRHQAEEINFSDKLQYDLFNLSRDEQMTSITKLEDEKREDILNKLGNHGAMILDNHGEVFSFGDCDTSKDPTNIASINTIRNAVQRYSEEQKEIGNTQPIFCLPDGFTLICRDIPHPAGLITADWARILRKRDNANPENPVFDSKIPDPIKIIHITENYEQMPVIDANNNIHIHQDAKITYKQPTIPDAYREIHTEQYIGRFVRSAAADVFKSWQQGTQVGEHVRY